MISSNFKKIDNHGQSLIELVIVIALSVLVTSALVISTIISIRNSSFSRNQTQATKLAQDGLEKLRSERDQDKDGDVNFYVSSQFSATKFSDLWNIPLNCDISVNNCYFYFDSKGVLQNGSNYESITNPQGFSRQFIITDDTDGRCAKKITAVVSWKDSAGTHESKLSTILRNNDCGAS